MTLKKSAFYAFEYSSNNTELFSLSFSIPFWDVCLCYCRYYSLRCNLSILNSISCIKHMMQYLEFSMQWWFIDLLIFFLFFVEKSDSHWWRKIANVLEQFQHLMRIGIFHCWIEMHFPNNFSFQKAFYFLSVSFL